MLVRYQWMPIIIILLAVFPPVSCAAVKANLDQNANIKSVSVDERVRVDCKLREEIESQQLASSTSS